MRSTLAALLLVLASTAALPAQEEAADTAAHSAEKILRALELPSVADILRERGVPDEEVEAAVEEAQAEDIAPEEMAVVLEETANAVEERGPIENFGAFVQTQLESGLRGRELAAAIRAEHARRGIGQGRSLRGERRPPDSMGGRPDSTRGGPGARGGQPDYLGGGQPSPRGSRPDSMRGGPPDNRGSGAEGRRDSMQGGDPGNRGGPPADRGRGGRPDSTRGPGQNQGNSGGGGAG